MRLEFHQIAESLEVLGGQHEDLVHRLGQLHEEDQLTMNLAENLFAGLDEVPDNELPWRRMQDKILMYGHISNRIIDKLDHQHKHFEVLYKMDYRPRNSMEYSIKEVEPIIPDS